MQNAGMPILGLALSIGKPIKDFRFPRVLSAAAEVGVEELAVGEGGKNAADGLGEEEGPW
jgi:hypothetical protein